MHMENWESLLRPSGNPVFTSRTLESLLPLRRASLLPLRRGSFFSFSNCETKNKIQIRYLVSLHFLPRAGAGQGARGGAFAPFLCSEPLSSPSSQGSLGKCSCLRALTLRGFICNPLPGALRGWHLPTVQFSASSLSRASLPRWRFLISSPPHLSPAHHSVHSTRA